MHVPSKQCARKSRPRRGPAAAALVALFASIAGIAQAVDFDEKLKAPMAKGAPELKTMAESYSATFARLQQASPTELLTNKAVFLEHFDLAWQLERAVDDQRPLEDLSGIGLVKRDDGSIEIDLKAFPQWAPFTETLAALVPTMSLTNVAPLLVNRGFRESDITTLKNYVATHDLKAASAAKTLPIAISFSKLVKKYDRLKLPVSQEMVLSYIYQRNKAEALVRREWAEGLLQSLDAQRVRVLHSYFDEMGGVTVWGPSDTAAGVAGLLAMMRRADYEQRATEEAKGVAP